MKQITNINAELLSKIEMIPIETFWAQGAEGAKVQSILVKPPFFNPEQKISADIFNSRRTAGTLDRRFPLSMEYANVRG